jgi:hypothetical protein
MRKEAAQVSCRHSDVVAGNMSLEKSAAVRSLQRDIASGKPLAAAIKTACPMLSGEQRGISASQMVRIALAHQQADDLSGPENLMQSANATITPPQGVMQTQRRTFRGSPQDGMSFMKAAGKKTAGVSPGVVMPQPQVGSGPASAMTARAQMPSGPSKPLQNATEPAPAIAQNTSIVKRAGNIGSLGGALGAAGRNIAQQQQPPMMPHADEPNIGALGAQAMGLVMPGVMQQAMSQSSGSAAQQTGGVGTAPAPAAQRPPHLMDRNY